MTATRFTVPATGPLLVAGARIALANDLFARRRGGALHVRIDDLDPERAKPGAAEQIEQDLGWIGCVPAGIARLSERAALYQAAIERLKRDAPLYPCFETEEELKAKAEFRRKRKQPAIYDRAMLALTPAQREAAEAGGKRPHWRLKLSRRTVAWKDMAQGAQQVALATTSDPVLVRADGTPTPLLAGVIDDLDQAVTHVIRAEDSPANTAAQIEIFEILTGRPCAVRFAHLPALSEPAARQAVRALRHDGIQPESLATCLMGTADAPLSMGELAARFEFSSVQGFDTGRVLALNRLALAALPFAAVADRLPLGATESFWLAVRGHLDLLREARGWWDVAAGSIVPPAIETERDLLAAAAAVLPPEPWDAGTWTDWTTALLDRTGSAPSELLATLRLALTGEETGPDLALLLPLMGRARAAERLSIAAA